MNNSKKFDNNFLLLAAGGVALFFLTMLIVPVADDWQYLTSPMVRSDYHIAQYRRLFDILIGLFNQAHPETFPWLNRVLIVFTHTVCSVFLYKIAREILGAREKLALVFALLFLIGGNTIITVVNYDCFNQTGSLMFGAMGIYMFAMSGSTSKKLAVYFASCALALLTKESGIVYFAIIPMFGFIKAINSAGFSFKAETKTLAKFYVPGFACALAYYLSPVIQSERLWVYGTGDAPITKYLWGIAGRLGFSYTQTDQTSLMPVLTGGASASDMAVAAACVLLSIPILLLSLYLFARLAKGKDKGAAIFALLVIQSIIVFAPTLLSAYMGSIHSQNCIVFFANLAFAYLLNRATGKTLRICVTSFAICAAVSASSLMYQYNQTGLRQENAIEAIRESYDSSKEVSSYKVFNLNISKAARAQSYPVRLYTIQQIFEFGGSMTCIFGYGAKCDIVNLTNDSLASDNIRVGTSGYMDMSDGELLAYAQGEAKKSVDSGAYDLALVVLPTDEFFLYQ